MQELSRYSLLIEGRLELQGDESYRHTVRYFSNSGILMVSQFVHQLGSSGRYRYPQDIVFDC